MKEKRVRELRHELKYLVQAEIEKEIVKNDEKLENEKIFVKEIAKNIYLERGIDILKLKKGFLDILIDNIAEMFSLFKNKSKSVKNRMYLEIIYIIILLVFMKIPFDLVRDIGYEYVELVTTSSIVYKVWALIFLLLYTITLICSFIVLARNFNKKYRDTSK